MNIDLFGPVIRLPGSKPRVMMHVVDAGAAGTGCMHEEDAEGIAKYQCAKCGHASEWMGFRTTTEAKRGIPCPKCNVTEQGLSATELK